jgi:3-oxoacyl-(acyl-carrier-protein) synthase
MRMALDAAGMEPRAIGAVFASANSSPKLDADEAWAIAAVFGGEPVPVCAVKSMLGESYGAGGAVAFVSAVLALKHGVVPPTVNYDEGDAACALPGVRAEAQPLPRPTVLVNAVDPGGACFTAVLRHGK